jgi:hypothetical protein
VTPERERYIEHVLTICTTEFNAIHALCDVAEVPRTTKDGAVFSAVQRVRALAMAWEMTKGALNQAAGDAPN